MKKITGILSVFSISALLFLTISCSRYQLVSMSYQEFIQNDTLNKAVSADVFVDDGINLYKLKDAEISEEGIKGIPELAARTDGAEKKFVKEADKDKYIHGVTIYTKVPVNVQSDQSGGSPVYQDSKITLGRNEIRKVKAYQADNNGVIIALIIVGGILLFIAGIIYLTVVLVSAANSSSSSSSGSSSGSSSSGFCYVATMVYGDYDAPEVKVLRNFRDNVLDKSAAGRLFIRVYYKYSPWFVERFRHSPAINGFIKGILDRVVRRLS
jgi:hypothetical protein